MLKKIALTFFVLPLFLNTFFVIPLYAQDDDNRKAELQKKVEEYQQKLDEARQQKNTLSSQITFMDTQISLAAIKIQETEKKVEETKNEIELLTNRIEKLDSSLDHLSKVLIQRVVDGYKQKSVSIFDYILNSANAGEFISQYKYLKTAQENNQKVLVQAQEVKSNFEEQKVLREKKKTELDTLKQQLAAQTESLNTQKEAKKRLLEVTKNDEATYQKLLEDAQAQLSSFKSFVQTAGGGTIGANAFGSGSDGAYMSQRDERWAYHTIGYSNENILEVGCLITSIAMAQKKDGANITPADIASNPNYFFSNTAYMLHPGGFSWPNGKHYTNISTSSIDDQLSNGKYVIVGVYAGKYGTHYIVLKNKDGSDYIMHDPYYGPDKKFSDYYSKSSIFLAAVFQ